MLVGRMYRAEVTLLRVISYPHYDYLMADPTLVVAVRENMEIEAKEYLDRVAEQLLAQAVQVKTHLCGSSGPVADAIIDYADGAGFKLIAMSTHGRTGPARWFLGSVADRVVRRARCPILMFRPVAGH